MESMANHKRRPQTKDYHQAATMVRLPDDIASTLRALAERNCRPLTWELRRIIIAQLQAEGLWPPSATST